MIKAARQQFMPGELGDIASLAEAEQVPGPRSRHDVGQGKVFVLTDCPGDAASAIPAVPTEAHSLVETTRQGSSVVDVWAATPR